MQPKLSVENTIEGGVIQHVEVPPGVTVTVRDYDCDPGEGIDRDADGNEYVESVYEG